MERARTGFSLDQIKTLTEALLHPIGSVIPTNSRKWGSLIGLYTGARLNEVAQLELSDVRSEDGIWYIDVNADGPNKRTKNDASARKVPIHQRLIGLGLLEYVEAMRREGATRLFPDFGYDRNNGYGRTLGRWFNDRFLPGLGLKTDQLVFHSLRHTVVTQLKEARVEHDLVQAIVGHTPDGTTAGYTDPPSLGRMCEALHKLPY